ncbi:uncharacterized protein THITE_2114887 [Thermothielavioides terrestris NRRL 8126]|uniref:Uncharacterized protein n=1 Tax=Thermothielavioides terrestris (strain ATCC 38088 / NRRL 8126) TaxID=578455 RepID=G2R270_THETT|nr:uncharacterized protein THITE_2114887 [Thermothielavioides terrestris NRRL 8126]AEO66654.1 hypothetical protein THITE_2114887 [Thermothielavioides terrestris NRRL 8126]
MWDRLKIMIPHHAERQVDNPLDDDRLQVGLGLSYGTLNTAKKGYSYSIKGGPPPPRPPREFLQSRYETATAVRELPVRNPNPNPKGIAVRKSSFRAASSVYPEDSPPLAPKFAANVATKYGYRYGGGLDGISPPSSPEPDATAANRLPPGDVSPIDEDDRPVYPRHADIPTTDALRNEGSDRGYAPAPRQGTQSPPQNRAATSIPMLRRERRRQSDAAAREAHSSHRGPAPQQSRNPPGREGPRWDPLTGERTSSAQGRPSQVNPAEFAQSLGSGPDNGWAPSQNSPTAAAPSWGDRVRKMAKKASAAIEGNTDPAAGAFTSNRPGWRGASGRSAIVDPVHDTREVPPLKIPEKSARRNKALAAESKPTGNTPDGGSARRGETPPISPPPSETPTRSGPLDTIRRILPSSQSPSAKQTTFPAAQRYPSPPLSGHPAAADAPAVAARELARNNLYGPRALPSPTFPPPSPESSQPIRRKPPPMHTNHQHQASVSSVYSQQTDAPQPSPLPVPDTARPPPAPVEEPYVQPPSRFSVTTYATSNTGTTRDDIDDPLDGNQPPVPALPADLQQQHPLQRRPSSDHSPVTSPIDQFMTSPFAEHTTTTTVMPNPAVARVQAQAQATDRPAWRASVSDVNKSLPPAPPEQSAGEAQDRVALLEARLRALANRRININRSITQMTELMPTDKLMNSAEVMRKREAEKRKVEALRAELAEVQREEHELGLKLHRAYKRLDREAEWEPTTLWVRRVTG